MHQKIFSTTSNYSLLKFCNKKNIKNENLGYLFTLIFTPLDIDKLDICLMITLIYFLI